MLLLNILTFFCSIYQVLEKPIFYLLPTRILLKAQTLKTTCQFLQSLWTLTMSCRNTQPSLADKGLWFFPLFTATATASECRRHSLTRVTRKATRVMNNDLTTTANALILLMAEKEFL